jgi:hypothetical protein
MKKIFTILVLSTILLTPAFSDAAQNQRGIHKADTNIENPQTVVENPELKQERAAQNMAEESQKANEKAVLRRSRVANAVQEMERIAVNNQGIGDQVRVIARNQNRTQEKAEGFLRTAQKRGGFVKFFIGPNYKQLKSVEKQLESHTQNITELKELKKQIKNSPDSVLLNEQIRIMEEITAELRKETIEEKKGFSLFGWLFKLLSK